MSKDMLGVSLRLVVVLLLFFIAHFVLFTTTDIGHSMVSLGYSLPILYLIEFVFSIGLVLSMVGIKNSMPHSLAYVFLGFITLRLVVSYIYVSEGLNGGMGDDTFKYNFLTVVLIFLGGDAYVAYNVLNKEVDSKNQ